MFLEKIEIQGFKSFAQKTVLEFPQPGLGCPLVPNGQAGKPADLPAGSCGIACIVGPNGSGKSNIVDSIRWVLGEQSLKSLRGKKSEDVIFSGSEKKVRLGMAYVGLHVNNQDGTMPIDYEQVVISRKLYRDGESEYRINKSRVRLQDVLLLLAKSNFGQKSYSIVSQGSIDQVIMANPNERKEYFDEAVGVKEFQLKRDGSINKLENAWNNLRQVEALLVEIKPRLNSLIRQVKRLERREKVEQELRQSQRQYYGWQWSDLDKKINTVSPQLKTAESEATKKNQAVRMIQDKLKALEKQDSRSKVFNELQQNYQKFLDEKNKLREEQLILQNQIEVAKQRLVEKISPLPLPDIISKIKEIDRLHDQIVSNLAGASAVQLAQAKQDIQDLTKLIKGLLKQLENPAVSKSGAGAAVDPELVKDLESTTDDLSAIEKKVSQARQAVENFNQKEEEQKGELFSLQRDLYDQQNEFNALSGQASQLRVELAKLETHNQDLEKTVQEELGDLSWLKIYQPQKINELELYSNIQHLKHQLELIGGAEPGVAEEYQKVKERYDFLSNQAEDLRTSIKSLEKVITDLHDKIQVQFDTAFKNINQEFSKFFKILFGGGKAELVLIKEEQKEPAGPE